MSKVFDRAMFKAENKPMKADSGIMQGFEDEEIPEDEMMEEVSQRKPNSPEILMNNLRGDMRSVDARYQELADMVGDDVAMETPPEVLALLQAQLAQQSMGIGALPPGQGVPPPPMPAGAPPMPTTDMMGGMPPQMGGMPQPGAMPQGPEGQMPQGFANGGIASLGNFSEGVAQAGRNGDTVLAHMTPEQNQYLTELGGGATVNPQTGLPEHYMGQQMLANLGQRAMPYLQQGARTVANMGQQANVLAGRALYNPVLTAPTLNQSRTTLGTFGPKVPEGMQMVYPTFTQGIANTRVGQMVGQGVQRLSKLPMGEKIIGAVGSSAIGKNIYDRMGGNLSVENNKPPVIPGDPATDPKLRGMPIVDTSEDVVPESTPVNYDNLPINPAAPAAVPESEADKNNKLIQAANERKTRGQRLEDYMSENVPIFEKYLGGDKDYNQAQALFVLADMGLKLATTRKKGESFVSSFARSAQGVPAGLSTIAASEEQAKRQIKSAALTSGLQTIAAEDKAAADIAKAIATRAAQGQKMTYTDVGAGMSRVSDNNGKLIGYEVQQSVKDEFLNDPIVPLRRVDEKNFAVTNPYATATPRPAAAVQTEAIRKKLESDQISSRDVINLIDNTIADIASVYGPGAFLTDFKNNIIVPLAPNFVASPETDFEGKRSKVALTLKEITTNLAKSGDSGSNIAVAERALAKGLAGKDPAAFFSDPELIMKNMMAIRTQFINNYYRRSAQLGHTDYNIKMDIPNLGTANDPIPENKSGYLDIIAASNPNAQLYIKDKTGKVTSMNLANRKE